MALLLRVHMASGALSSRPALGSRGKRWARSLNLIGVVVPRGLRG